MKKVCIITTVHSVFDIRIYHKEAKSLVRVGYEVILIARHKINETVGGVKILALPFSRNRLLRFLYLDYKATNLAFKQKADIYHFHDPEFLPWACLLKKNTRAKIIYDVHEDVPKQILSKKWIPRFLRKPISYFFNLFEKKCASKFDAIISVVPVVAEKFKNKYSICVANYPKLDYFEQIGGLVDEKNKKSVFTAIYVGGMTEIRGIRQIIEANRLISARKKIKLVMAGPFSDNGFENEIKANPEWKKIDYLGVLPIKDVYKEITAADVGLVCLQPEPNYVIAQPIKMFEYMAAGIPVIASNFSKYREIIENNKCGLCVDPREPAKIADAIIHIMEHPDEARKMGENGRKAVRELYNWEKEEEKLLETYKRLLS